MTATVARFPTPPGGRLVFDEFELDRARGALVGRSGAVPLTPKALALLEYLAARPGQLVTKHELLEAVWPGVFVADGALKVCIREIRRALGDDAHAPRFIETAHRRGYRFIAPLRGLRPVEPAPAPVAAVEPAIPVCYARSGGVNIAYQVIGRGPIDLVFVMGWVSHLECYWREPSFARFLRRMAGFSRLILFDKRGTGLSDPVRRLPTLEQRMDDVRAVMDAVGSARAVLMGVSEGGPMTALFAATYPNRTEALVMIGTYARRTRTPDYPWAPTDAEREAFCRDILAGWGGPVGLEDRAPSMAGDPAFRDWWATYLRMGASPAAAVALTRMNAQIDIRHTLPSVRVPALVLHRAGDRCLKVEEGRYVASLMPAARFVELPGEDHLPFVGDQDALLDEVEAFVSQTRTRGAATRRLATVVCVALSAAGGRRAGATSVARCRAIAASEAARFGGGSVTGDGDRVLVVFDGPARAIRCARAIAAVSVGASVRVGLHTGGCDVAAPVAGELVAAIAAQVAALAGPGDVLVSRTVVDLVAGSGLRFTPRGTVRVSPDLPDWRVFAVGAEEE